MKVVKRFITSNYDGFRITKGNRDFSLTHAKNLAQDIIRSNMLEANPIICQRDAYGKLEVYDGQHRLHACKLLNIPVPVIEVSGLVPEDIALLNRNQKGWGTKDYLQHFSALDSDDYRQLDLFVEQTGLPVSLAANMTSVGNMKAGGVNKSFKAGQYKSGDMAGAREIAAILDKIRDAGCKFTRDRSFVRAISAIHRTGIFDVNRLVSRLKTAPLEKCASWQAYVSQIDQRYNYRVRVDQKVALFFEATKDRNG